MTRTISLTLASILALVAVAALAGPKAAFQLLGEGATSVVTGGVTYAASCAVTYQAMACPNINEDCTMTNCGANGTCGPTLEGHSDPSKGVPQCTNSESGDGTQCGTGYSYYCGTQRECGNYCNPGSVSGIFFCSPPVGSSMPAYFYRGNKAVGGACEPLPSAQ